MPFLRVSPLLVRLRSPEGLIPFRRAFSSRAFRISRESARDLPQLDKEGVARGPYRGLGCSVIVADSGRLYRFAKTLERRLA
jgi:hypothetical protein